MSQTARQTTMAKDDNTIRAIDADLFAPHREKRWAKKWPERFVLPIEHQTRRDGGVTVLCKLIKIIEYGTDESLEVDRLYYDQSYSFISVEEDDELWSKVMSLEVVWHKHNLDRVAKEEQRKVKLEEKRRKRAERLASGEFVPKKRKSKIEKENESWQNAMKRAKKKKELKKKNK
tara:strand:- start:7961 stop:8485 length:525 start_codon:yes stop_codon:yes gene_type:complete